MLLLLGKELGLSRCPVDKRCARKVMQRLEARASPEGLVSDRWRSARSARSKKCTQVDVQRFTGDSESGR